ncbi:argininosuccinate synthetase [Elasticomyces elasticus]|uniref:argininosuccinate synthase n=1 Tax=Exophiala sideris TaxID=1016849 RepID=A0ABR0IV51_9EURO|nr:argininosuccinate synthetase [Elasticomyces elasticus]KAK5021269.1 argininosuccinate synthetase [Exophiala sideris]KAK5024260.1 argininosuccinate synthetase [Exophiala sideris]KAK5049202.1 argininosuccinate synthetase [Exophiala sideris]KAK5176512.1 argininosuccinate synthetase [Eurotiomycetes sp. CCFEE 6388]
MPQKQKVCLAYSGGLDTSVIALWLIEQGYEVVCFAADVGQDEDFDAVRAKAEKLGAKIYIEDCRDEFVKELCFPAIQCNAVYENVYLLGTSLARPAIARAQIAVAEKEGCQFVAHGATGKGNDQIRLEEAYYALKPTIKVLAPWRMPEFYEVFKGRSDLLDYAEKKGIPVTSTKSKPWSMDENLAHCSYEAGILEDPDTTPPNDMWKLTADPIHSAADKPEDVTIEFEKGLPVKLSAESTGSETEPTKLFLAANALARKHGVGRVDIVENRHIGLKSRGCYETPGLTILRTAHIDIEGLTLDREVRALRDQFVTFNWSKILYNGNYFSPEREFLQASIIESQKSVNGQVRLRLYKGNCIVLGRSSVSFARLLSSLLLLSLSPMLTYFEHLQQTEKLYDASMASMDEIGDFEPTDATGFIKVQAIRLKKYGQMKAEKGERL